MGSRIQKEKAMKCIICKQAETQLGTTTVMLNRDGFTWIVRNVPAEICPNCGEDYVDEKIAARLLEQIQMVETGTLVDIREYVPA
jgi:YgiT-type zinc finger domain-containing protein